MGYMIPVALTKETRSLGSSYFIVLDVNLLLIKSNVAVLVALLVCLCS